MKIYLEASARTREVGECDTEYPWDRPDTDTSWSFGNFSFKRLGYDCLDIEAPDNLLPSDKIFVTVAVWSDGDSFGNDYGRNAEIFSVHRSREAAEKAKKALEGGKSILDVDLHNEKTTPLGDGYYLHYAPWQGYFVSLDCIEIVSGIIN